jgi:adenylate cyclase
MEPGFQSQKFVAAEAPVGIFFAFVDQPDPRLGWLEQMGHPPFAVAGTCTIGRAASNHLVLKHDKVSRRHAVIHVQDQDEYWLVDLGSSNGTLLNGRRVTQPVQLRDGDQIEIRPFHLVFRHPDSNSASAPEETTSNRTVQDIHSTRCWLLLVDIVGSTSLSRQLPPHELATLTGRWFERCKELTESNGGIVDKYLGDGFLAFWEASNDRVQEVTRMIYGLKALQRTTQPAFRFVFHYGEIFAGGLSAFGGERLFGVELNFLFRAERLASSQRWASVLTEAAVRRLPLDPAPEPAGTHPIEGFAGDHLFFLLDSRENRETG